MSERDPLQDWIEAEQPPAEQRAAYAQLERLLREASPLSRRGCPPRADLIATPAELGASLSAARERHLTACPLCRSDLADFQVLSEEPAEAWSTARARLRLWWDQAAQALRQTGAGWAPAWAPVPALRSEEAPQSLAQRVALEQGELVLTWARGESGLDLLCAAEGLPGGYRLDLSAGGALVESRSADEGGRVRILGLAPGIYRLSATLPGAQTPALEVELELGLGPEAPPPPR